MQSRGLQCLRVLMLPAYLIAAAPAALATQAPTPERQEAAPDNEAGPKVVARPSDEGTPLGHGPVGAPGQVPAVWLRTLDDRRLRNRSVPRRQLAEHIPDHSTDDNVRAAAAAALQTEAREVADLLRRLDDPQPETRAFACQSLGYTKPAPGVDMDAVLAALVRRLDDPDPHVAGTAARMLGWLRHRPAVGPIIRLFRAHPTDVALATHCVEALADLGEQQVVFDAARVALRSDNENIRYWATMAIENVPSPEVVPFLVEHLPAALEQAVAYLRERQIPPRDLPEMVRELTLRSGREFGTELNRWIGWLEQGAHTFRRPAPGSLKRVDAGLCDQIRTSNPYAFHLGPLLVDAWLPVQQGSGRHSGTDSGSGGNRGLKSVPLPTPLQKPYEYDNPDPTVRTVESIAKWARATDEKMVVRYLDLLRDIRANRHRWSVNERAMPGPVPAEQRLQRAVDTAIRRLEQELLWGDTSAGLRAGVRVEGTAEDGTVQLALRLLNAGSTPVRVPALAAWAAIRNPGQVLEVRIGGEALPYRGPTVKRGLPLPQSEYVTLYPGQAAWATFDFVPEDWGLRNAAGGTITFVFRCHPEGDITDPVEAGKEWVGDARSNRIMMDGGQDQPPADR